MTTAHAADAIDLIAKLFITVHERLLVMHLVL